jgi:RNA-directed DNA polymerase
MAEIQSWGRVERTKGQGLTERPETGLGVFKNRARYPRWTEAMVNALEPIRRQGRKWFQLYDKIADEKTLTHAWERINARVSGEARRRGAGVDGETIETFSVSRAKRIEEITEAMKKGTYKPSPVKRQWIPKPGSNKKRPLGLPTIADKIVQEAARGVIEPIWEAQFLDGSHGFRPGRSTDTACQMLEAHLAIGKTWVADADIKGCFDNISHKAIDALIARHIADGKVRDLISNMMKAGVMEGWSVHRTAAGTPQGGIISPLLCNIVLHELDTMGEVRRRFRPVVRNPRTGGKRAYHRQRSSRPAGARVEPRENPYSTS